MAEKRVLIVDDVLEDALVRKDMLERYGYRAEVANSSAETFAKITSFEPILILLDVNFKHLPKSEPYEDGYELCRAIRQLPGYQRGKGKLVMMISAVLTGDNDRVTGYASGTDRYLVRPISPSLLLAEIEALWPPKVEPILPEIWKKISEDLQVHQYEPYVKITCRQSTNLSENTLEEGRPMSKMIHELLNYLIDKSPKLCSRKELLKHVFKTEYGSNQQIDSAIHDLRSVVECDPRNPRHIINVRGFGYKFER